MERSGTRLVQTYERNSLVSASLRHTRECAGEKVRDGFAAPHFFFLGSGAT